MPATNSLLLALLHPAAAAAVGVGSRPGWTFPLGVVLPLLLVASAYIVGLSRIARARAQRSRPESAGPVRGVRMWRVWCFIGACVAVVLALLSPVDEASSEISLAHMVQHELLMIGAAPLFVASAPLGALLMALPRLSRARLARVLRAPWVRRVLAVATMPVVVWLAHAVAIWAWHIPALYEWALRREWVHAVEHACFFGTAILFWWGIVSGRYGHRRYGAAVVYVFATAMHSGLLGAAMALSPAPWYPAYATTTQAWGLSPLEDQQLAGLVMWVPAGLVFTAVGLVLFAAWMRDSEASARVRRSGWAAALLVLVGAGVSCGGDLAAQAGAMTGGDVMRGRQAIDKYGCPTCHVIPGVRTARGRVGPPLDGVASRVYLAGHLMNRPDVMQAWIQHPHAYDPLTVMPETGISAQEARDVAAYLYTLR